MYHTLWVFLHIYVYPSKSILFWLWVIFLWSVLSWRTRGHISPWGWMKSWLFAEFSPLLCSHNSVWFTAALPHWGVISSVNCWKVWLDWVTKAAASTTRPCVSHMQVSEKQTQSSCHISISFSSFLCSKRSSVTLFTFHVSLPNCVPRNYILQMSTLCGWDLLQMAFWGGYCRCPAAINLQ